MYINNTIASDSFTMKFVLWFTKSNRYFVLSGNLTRYLVKKTKLKKKQKQKNNNKNQDYCKKFVQNVGKFTDKIAILCGIEICVISVLCSYLFSLITSLVSEYVIGMCSCSYRMVFSFVRFPFWFWKVYFLFQYIEIMSTCLWWLRITCAYFIKKKWYKCTLKLQSYLKLLVTKSKYHHITLCIHFGIYFTNKRYSDWFFS